MDEPEFEVSTFPGEHRQPLPGQLELVPAQAEHSEPPEPRYGTRALEPGPRGCWALKNDGTACGAAKRRDSDYCTAHSGHGVAADPARYAPIGRAAAAVARQRRAALRATLGITRSHTARGVLKAAVFVERERIAAAAIAGAIDLDVPAATRAAHALKLIDAVEPPESVSLQVEVPTSAEDVGQLGLGELRALLEGAG